MKSLSNYVSEYLEYCQYRKRLDSKTLKAYSIDLKQYESYICDHAEAFSKDLIDSYITDLHKKYEPKTVKRKIASLKAFISMSGMKILQMFHADIAGDQ